MAEKIISPGVLTKEVDASFLPAALGDIGAAIIGPTVKGPVLVPTIIQNKRELEDVFGSLVESGSNKYEYFTTITAKNYLKHKSPITIVRVAGDNSSVASNSSLTNAEVSSSIKRDHNQATANTKPTFLVNDKGAILSSTDPAFIGTGVTSGDWNVDTNHFARKATGSFTLGTIANDSSMSIGNATFIFTASAGINMGGNKNQSSAAASTNPGFGNSILIYVASGSSTTDAGENLKLAINDSGSLHGLPLSASNPANGKLKLECTSFGTYFSGSHISHWNGSSAIAGTLIQTSSVVGQDSVTDIQQLSNGQDNLTKLTIPFKLHTLTEGSVFNTNSELTSSNTDKTGELVNGSQLKSGSLDNFKWEIQDVSKTRGTFTLLIRAGNDTFKRKQVQEQWENLSLDPTQPNYIAKIIGNQYHSIAGSGTEQYVKMNGEFPNKSKYVRVEVFTQTPNYLDENGNIKHSDYSASLPAEGSGSAGGGFTGGSDGNIQHPQNFYENITKTNTQGLNPTVAANGMNSYQDAINLLANQDEYDINLLFMPGLVSSEHGSLITKAIDMCEDRQDTFFVFDTTLYDSAPTTAASQADGYNTNYAATYYPWLQIMDTDNKHRWIPPSSGVAEAYAFNDKISQPWFAPAGLNRGKVSAVSAERKLLDSQRNALYKSSVNPIATFPGQGVVVFGQKTLQKKLSALDRINVRRLLIKVKKFIASSSRFLLFEQNTPALRKSFLNIANPFLERVKSQSGLTAFKVVMDDTNNTPDTIDRNQLVGQIYLQPTKSAEFIMLDFIVQRTGASFEE